MKKKNQWYVITGAPNAGKTTLIKQLEQRGYKVYHEMARLFIDEKMAQGLTLKQIRKDELSFQREVLKRKIKLEKKLPKNKMIFFDRGIPDSYAYYKIRGFKISGLLKKAVLNSAYKKIFLLDYYDYKKDYARVETRPEQILLHKLLREAYEKFGLPVAVVPKLKTKAARVKFILDNL